MKLTLSLLSLFCIVLSAQANSFLVRSNKKTYNVDVTTSVEHWGVGHSKTDLFLAFFSSNQYQICRSANVDSLAEITHLGYAGDLCLYYDLPLGRKERLKKRVEFKNSFTLETYDVEVDFDAIGTIEPYDPCDLNVMAYSGSNYPFIDVQHPQLFQVSEAIWNESNDVIDYARNCYYWVARNFTYADPETGFKTLDYTFQNKKGDCGNMCNVYITLLRMQHIPARHLMGFRPDGSLHVWADFYIQNVGWIPVDVTYENQYPSKDYFGKIKFEHNGFIVQRGIGQEVSVLEQRKRITALQTYSYEVSYEKQHHAKVYIDRKISCQEIN